MIKFIRKKHIAESIKSHKIVIYYSISDIFLGTALILLVMFFIHDYISHSMIHPQDRYTNDFVSQQNKTLPKFNAGMMDPKPY